MAKYVATGLFGVMLGMLGGAACGVRAAQDLDDVALEIVQVASRTGKDPVKLAGAVSTTGLRPEAYLIMVGELEPPAPPPKPIRDTIDVLIDCLAWAESRNTPSARNRSGASGLLQFMPGTFAGTPQGRSGASIWDPVAQRQAARWMINQGRLKEWSTWRSCA